MKKIFWILVLFFLFLFIFKRTAFGGSAYCDGLVAITAKDIEVDQKPLVGLQNLTASRRNFVVVIYEGGAYDPFASIRTQRICIALNSGEEKSIKQDLLEPIVFSGNVNVILRDYEGTDDCGDGKIIRGTGHGRYNLCDHITFYVSEKKEAGCTVTTDRSAYKPGESPIVTVTNNSSKAAYFVLYHQYPDFVTKIFDGVKKILPGESAEFQAAPVPSAKDMTKAYFHVYKDLGAYMPPPAVKLGLCNTDITITYHPEKILERLQVFRPACCNTSSGQLVNCDASNANGIQTALGCIPTEIQPLISWLFKYGISIAGGIAFLMIIFSAFQMITSAGDPEKLEKAKQMLGSAIAGLLFIIFAVFLLRIIGVDILKIF